MNAAQSVMQSRLSLRPPRKQRGFSLIELLCVVAVIGIAAAMVIPAVGDLSASSKRTRFLYEISGLFETARQHAVSKNTYVWVAFSEDNPNDPLTAAIIGSKDGLSQGYGADVSSWPTKTVTPGAANVPFEMVSRPLSLGYFGIQPASDSRFSTAPTFQVKQSGTNVNLTRSIQFSPSGEAKVGPELRGTMVYDLFATQGPLAKQRETVTDQVLVNGPTGFCRLKTDVAR